MSERPHPGGSSAALLELCGGYFVSYVFTGILVKYFTVVRTERMSELGYLFNNTLGSSVFALGVAILLGWPRRLVSLRSVTWGGLRLPVELLVIVPSGVCTAIIIPATTLLYTLPVSVMVAMVIMRGSIIVVSRLVDEIQIRQGILHRRVVAEENVAVFFALLAVATNVLLAPLRHRGLAGTFDFLHSGAALAILGLYVLAYAIRIYIMNWYKNTRSDAGRLDNRGFFAVEQIAAFATMVVAGALVCFAPALWGAHDPRIVEFAAAARHPVPAGLASGLPYGLVAFFSVFIFMFQGRTATFVGLVNRLTSLLAGIAATLLTHVLFRLALPSLEDWTSVGFILIAVFFLTRAERRRARSV